MAKIFHGHFGTEATATLVRKLRPLWYGILYVNPLALPVVAPAQNCASVESILERQSGVPSAVRLASLRIHRAAARTRFGKNLPWDGRGGSGCIR
jgi:hypothetical protein